MSTGETCSFFARSLDQCEIISVVLWFYPLHYLLVHFFTIVVGPTTATFSSGIIKLLCMWSAKMKVGEPM